jgi:hypothetical protein
MTAGTHPDDETLVRFVLGRLNRSAMARVEAHLWSCSQCGGVAMGAPDDRLVRLLRDSAVGSATQSSAFGPASFA